MKDVCVRKEFLFSETVLEADVFETLQNVLG
jgi:hypothetical protein